MFIFCLIFLNKNKPMITGQTKQVELRIESYKTSPTKGQFLLLVTTYDDSISWKSWANKYGKK